jgi:hypothetical protein
MDTVKALGVALRVMQQQHDKLVASEGYLTSGGAWRPLAGKPRHKQLEDIHRAIPVLKELQRRASV